jgi:hypothetical protein
MAIKLIDPLKGEEAPFILPAKPTSDWKPSKPREATTYRAAKRNASREPDPFGRDPVLLSDFRNFLTIVWKFLRLPSPSAVQLSLAWYLANGPTRSIIMGFRGMAKSWITGAYALWKLYCNPQLKVLIVSANLARAVQTVQWCLALIREMPELAFLKPDLLKNQRASGTQFDVGPALPDQSPSMKGAGITGQITGSRAHLIVPDDIEIPANAMTVLMREKIREAVKEFDAVIHPGGEIKYLGTPQVDDSLYVKLQTGGLYKCRIWPAEYPNKKDRLHYGDKLSPWIARQVDQDPTLVGHSVWPGRFSDEDLSNRKLSYGRSGYALQFMLNTSMMSGDKFPLKLRDLIVDGCDYTVGPDVISWGNASDLIIHNLPSLGFEGDKFHWPASKSKTSSPYNTVKASIDSSGRGGNETVLTIGAELHGRIFLLNQWGSRDGYSKPTLEAIATKLVQFRVNHLVIEDNFGDGMFLALLTPVVIEAWRKHNEGKPHAIHGGTTIEGIKSPRVQKEVRILSVLEPATQQHRLVINTTVIEEDAKAAAKYTEDVGQETGHHYSLIHQMTHLTRERECLLQDDRVEGLAMLVAQFADVLGINPWESAKQRDEDRWEKELEALFEEAEDLIPDDTQKKGPKVWERHKQAIRPS